MQILGLTKTTLLDYPGHVAAAIFLGGCNFRCPFCHNRDIVFAAENSHNSHITAYTEQEILAFLRKRRRVLTGVCITGGEPTLHNNLPKFLEQIKELGYLIKLDTNGSNPEMLRLLIQEQLIDYCAMDIKNAFEKYIYTIGMQSISTDTELLKHIQQSVNILMSCDSTACCYEFRTTIVQEFHTEADLLAISKRLAGAQAYFLQSYVESEGVIQKGYHAYNEEMMKKLECLCRTYIPNTFLRGI